eukprot:COSAG02_NODE_67813_length_253_cov_0.666667_1_plen_56_part_01
MISSERLEHIPLVTSDHQTTFVFVPVNDFNNPSINNFDDLKKWKRSPQSNFKVVAR